jgi:hypothetical protein
MKQGKAMTQLKTQNFIKLFFYFTILSNKLERFYWQLLPKYSSQSDALYVAPLGLTLALSHNIRLPLIAFQKHPSLSFKIVNCRKKVLTLALN